ncbi:hypothetical protein [Nocardioides sp. B-3]|uniref:hypothetical protein n=1 Tax=Nocardioides sp. B-3 TaxID=2895565 RepID=UPI003FA61069
MITGDGSVGVRGAVPSQIGGILERADADVVYAVGPREMLRAVASAAEQRGARSRWRSRRRCRAAPACAGAARSR